MNVYDDVCNHIDISHPEILELYFCSHFFNVPKMNSLIHSEPYQVLQQHDHLTHMCC